MKSFLKRLTVGLLAMVTFGCAQHSYNVPLETFEQKVQNLGVAPIFVDPDSDIRHPEKEAIVNILKEDNRKNDPELVALLKDTKLFFTVQALPDDADQLFSALFFRRERREDAGVIYNKYFFKGPELKELIAKNGVDALMVVVVSGLTKKEKVYSTSLLSYLESNYNNLIMTAQILDGDGNILWEYPNFRQSRVVLPPLFALQYPDFEEAAANMSDQVEVKFKSVAGISKALGNATKSAVRNNARVSSLYAAQFDVMMSLLVPEKGLFSDSKKKERRPEAPQPESK